MLVLRGFTYARSVSTVEYDQLKMKKNIELDTKACELLCEKYLLFVYYYAK